MSRVTIPSGLGAGSAAGGAAAGAGGAASGGWLSRNVGAGLAAASAASAVSEALPVFEELVQVAVHGTSGSNKRRLFFLAMATALGQVHNIGAAVPCFYNSVEYDMMGKSVTVTLAYTYSGLVESTNQAKQRGLGRDPIFQSVDEDLVAGDLNSTLFGKEVIGIPLPDAKGTIIAIGSPIVVQQGDKTNNPNNNPLGPNAAFNPAPSDGGSRGTYAQALVYAALASPCLPLPDVSITPEPGTGDFSGDPGSGGDTDAFGGQLSVEEVIRRLLGG